MTQHQPKPAVDPVDPDPVSAETALLQHERGLRAFFVRNLRSRDDADDYVQEVFTRVLAGVDEENVRHWGGFLHRVASNLLMEGHRRNRVRHRSQHIELDDAGEIAAPDTASPERIALGRDALRRLDAALEEMPPLRQQVFVLIRLQGKSYREVAAMLEMTESAVGKQLDKAVAFLARRHAEES